MKCNRDAHMFSESPDATHVVTRHYGDGSFFKFYVCDRCLPLLTVDANKYNVRIEVEELKDG